VPSATTLAMAWAALSPAMNTHSQMPVTFSQVDWDELAAGQVVKTRLRLDGADRAVGTVWTATPRTHLWIAISDDRHDTMVDNLTERHETDPATGHKFLYQHIDLPWPVQDRQWVADIWDNAELYAATEGAVWERCWDLASPDTASQPDPHAIWVPVNEGTWMLADLAGGTLLLYQVRTVVGGAIPDELTTAWAMATLDNMLDHVIARAAHIPPHYGSSHTAFARPDGEAIPPMLEISTLEEVHEP